MTPEQNKELIRDYRQGGCAAKLSAKDLSKILSQIPKLQHENLLTEIDKFEDAAVYKLSNELAIIQTVDFFPPLVDDPFLYGKIAAVNALSDIYAMGGSPLLALNILSFPSCDYPLTLAEKIIAGGAEAIQESGALLVGGHSIQSKDIIYGLSVTGIVNPNNILKNSKAKAGDYLVLCKALGSGILLLAKQAKELSNSSFETLIESLTKLNAPCLNLALKYKINAATDITGFGLLGHVHEMCIASNLSAKIHSSSLPIFPDALEFAKLGFVPAAAYANRNAYEAYVSYNSSLDLAITDLLFDPQSSGGLLFSLSPEEAKLLSAELISNNWPAQIIGEFISGKTGYIEVE